MKYKENPKKIQRAIRHLHHGDVKAEEKRDISAGGWLYVANYNAIGQWSRVSLLTDISLQSNAVTQRNKQTNKHTHSAHPFLPWVCYQCDTAWQWWKTSFFSHSVQPVYCSLLGSFLPRLYFSGAMTVKERSLQDPGHCLCWAICWTSSHPTAHCMR